MANFGSIMKGIFYLLLIVLGALLVWQAWSLYVFLRKSGSQAGQAWVNALKGALDPTKETFFIWRLPILNKTFPTGKAIGEKLRGWFGMPTGMPGGSANPFDQNVTGEQAVLLEPNFPPNITRQVTPYSGQPDPVSQPASAITGTDGTGVVTPWDNVVPFSLQQESA